MSNELKHDPDFPYVVMFGNYVAARFPANESGLDNARSYAEESLGELVDTTPKPRIPADVAYITWRDRVTERTLYARRVSFKNWMTSHHIIVSEDALIRGTGDAEISALDARTI